MSVQKGMGFYHVEVANTNRHVTFTVQPTALTTTNSLFLALKGNNAFPPWIGATTSPTTNQLVAQYRFDYVVRFLAVYAPIVKATVVDFNSHTSNALEITFETAVSQVFPAYVSALTDGAGTISDTLGIADRATKTKPGLQTLVNTIVTTASLDGGSTLLFSASPNLADGTASTAPDLSGGLTVALLEKYAG